MPVETEKQSTKSFNESFKFLLMHFLQSLVFPLTPTPPPFYTCYWKPNRGFLFIMVSDIGGQEVFIIYFLTPTIFIRPCNCLITSIHHQGGTDRGVAVSRKRMNKNKPKFKSCLCHLKTLTWTRDLIELLCPCF